MASCKTVNVLVPAKYTLFDHQEVVVHDFKGSEGATISHYILADLQQHLPQLIFYTATTDGLHGSAVHLTGQLDTFNLGKKIISWGEFNEESHQQSGSVKRDIDIQVSIQVKNQQQQVLWSHIFSKHEEQSEYFSLYSDEAYQSLDGASDIWKGKILRGISDFVTQNDMEEEALSSLPSDASVRQKMITDISQTIAQSFYDHMESHLEFK
ncbi:MAG: hypothetical protein Q9M10_05700 [Mariprofundaceae bacterium]|nr:hypothetical protein [Mariprofundaceae bacterium]